MTKEQIIKLDLLTLTSIAGACAVMEHCKGCPYLIKDGINDYCFFRGSDPYDQILPEDWDFSKINWEVANND